MRTNKFSFTAGDGTTIYTTSWLPEDEDRPKGIVQIAHGMAEVGDRYQRLAMCLTGEGYIVYCHDHRGHGKTAGSVEALGYLAKSDGFDWMVKDCHQLTGLIKAQHPDLPIYLFGHSMGSFVAQRYAMLFGNEINGLILSGSNGEQGFILTVGQVVAKLQIAVKGRKFKSKLLDNMSFGNFNNKFKPNRTPFDWLSRDEAEVDAYIKNPYCGTVFTAGFFYDFMKGLKIIEAKENYSKTPRSLPIYIFSGSDDPVGQFGKGVVNLYKRYKAINVKDVTYKLYEGGRHEMLNETNRIEVMDDILYWLKER